MDSLSTRDCEGFVAQVNALQVAQRALRNGDPDAIAAIHRIAQSLQHTRAVPAVSEILKLSVRLDKTADDQLARELEDALPRLLALVDGLRSERVGLLLVEDNPAMVEFLRQRLAAPHRDLHVAQTIAQAEKILAEKEIALVVLDLMLPDGDGRSFIMRLRERSTSGFVPLIVVSAKAGPQVESECFALGADAYFVKPFDPVTFSIVVASKLQQAMDVKRQSGHDLLTGLPNRAAYNRAFRRASMLALRSRQPLSVAILDLDLFKTVNDTYGHSMGDQVLRRLSQVIAQTLRTSDLLARWGGEEFAVFFPNTDVKSAKLALTSALKAVRAEKFVSADGHSFSLSFSAGLSGAKKGLSADEVIADADRILYLAKQSGRNRILTPLDKPLTVKRTILIVEDNAWMASVMKHHLRDQGFRLVRVRDAEGALNFVADHAVSLITVDVCLPGMDGFELLKRLRDVPTLGHIPIIMVTSNAQKKDILKGFHQGANDYIVKPFAPAELRARVHRFLKPRVLEKIDR